MLKTLIKIRLHGLFANQMRGSKNSKTGGIGKILLMVLLFGYIGVVFSALFGGMFLSLIEPFHMLGIDWLYFALMGIMIIMLCFIGSVFLVQHEIYQAKDNHLLLSMPIKSSDILLSRIFVILLLNYLYEIIVAGPAFAVYIWNVGMNVTQIICFIIVVLTLPLLVLALSSAFGWAMEHIMRHVTKKNVVTLVLSIAFFGVYFYAISSIEGYIGMLIENGKSIAQAIEQGIFPIYHLGIAIQEANILSLLIYLVCAIIPFAIVMYILSRSFIKLATSDNKTKKVKYVEKPMEVSTLNKALLKREARHFFSNAMVVLNGTMGVIMTILAAGAIVFYKDDLMKIVNLVPQISDYLMPILCIVGVGVSSLNIISASLISLEGNRLWQIKVLPVPAENILLSKLALHLIICIPSGILFSTVGAILFQLSFFDSIVVILCPILFTTLIALFGLLMNLWKPKFDWINETACVKQSMPVVVTMFASMGLTFVIVFLYMTVFSNYISLDIYTYVVLIVTLLCNVYMYYLLKTWGVKRFQEL